MSDVFKSPNASRTLSRLCEEEINQRKLSLITLQKYEFSSVPCNLTGGSFRDLRVAKPAGFKNSHVAVQNRTDMTISSQNHGLSVKQGLSRKGRPDHREPMPV